MSGPADTARQWRLGQAVLCSCPGHGGSGVVASAGADPIVLLADGRHHTCSTARLIDRRAGNTRPITKVTVRLADLPEGARSWLRDMSTERRRIAVVDAVHAAYDRDSE